MLKGEDELAEVVSACGGPGHATFLHASTDGDLLVLLDPSGCIGQALGPLGVMQETEAPGAIEVLAGHPKHFLERFAGAGAAPQALTHRPAGLVAGSLQSREQQSCQNGDKRNDDWQFNQGESRGSPDGSPPSILYLASGLKHHASHLKRRQKLGSGPLQFSKRMITYEHAVSHDTTCVSRGVLPQWHAQWSPTPGRTRNAS